MGENGKVHFVARRVGKYPSWAVKSQQPRKGDDGRGGQAGEGGSLSATLSVLQLIPQ